VAAIILAGRTESSLESTAAELAKSFPGLKVSHFIVDITSSASVDHLFESLSNSPDILVNNAGYLSEPENIVIADLLEWWKGFEINVFGTVKVTLAYLQHRAALSHRTKEPGVVITVNTFAAFSIRGPDLSSYITSKAALARAFEMFSADVPKSVARFISVQPGAVKTAMYKKSGLEAVPSIPITDSQLSAEFIVWSASEEATFLSGRFVWANWDVDELVAKKSEILDRDLLISSLREV
jgi:short-subunit dehydrogenase